MSNSTQYCHLDEVISIFVLALLEIIPDGQEDNFTMIPSILSVNAMEIHQEYSGDSDFATQGDLHTIAPSPTKDLRWIGQE